VKSNKSRLSGVLFTLSVVSCASLVGCGQQNTQRDNVNASNAADAQARFQDLAPAEGNYSGTVLLSQSHQSFAMNLSINRIMEPARSSQAQDPSESVSIPVLNGNMSFPALENLQHEDPSSRLDDLSNFTPLTDPMGQNLRANIQEGTFDGTTLVLPYSVEGASGIYGELSGQLSGGHFVGNWTSEEASGMVGTFDLVVTPRSGQ
jgi:hypothetical protein